MLEIKLLKLEWLYYGSQHGQQQQQRHNKQNFALKTMVNKWNSQNKNKNDKEKKLDIYKDTLAI